MTIAAADSIAKPHSSALRQLLAVAALIAAMTVLRIVYASVIDLRTDEAYYWTWSKESVLSFLDHPPMIAWFIRFGTAIFGDTNLGVRFAGILAMLATQLLLADIVRRVTHDFRAIALVVLMPEAALYYGLLMAKVSPDVALIPFAVAMLWALVRLAESGDGRWWLAAGVFAGLSLLSKFTAMLWLPAVAAFMLVPSWRRRWLSSPYPWAAALIAVAVFSPVLIWNAGHDWASFRFQFVRAFAAHELSLRTVGDFIGLQFGLVGIILMPVVLSGASMMAWRGYRRDDAVAILLSTAVLLPFLYFLWKSLTLRVGDTWPMFMWPAGFAAAAINIALLPRQGYPAWLVRSAIPWARAAIVSGIIFVVAVFLYYVVTPWNFLGKVDPIGGEAGYEQVADRAQAELQKTGATWIATTDYRTYAMLRWFFNGRVPVIQINERGRFMGFGDPGMNLIRGHAGLYVGRVPDDRSPLWEDIPAHREPLERVDRNWRGIVMDSYALEKLTGWTPELSPPPDSPLYRWRVLAGEVHLPWRVAALANSDVMSLSFEGSPRVSE
ncbi:Dolichyl-phosphate-mannose-protein mannosyltransferase [Bradyrhizobium erythrophlei]|uniref:Dolichyl-phosphate-mannose-protein mannosyltransferase n=2 Tax=Bradyrhizobium erythrophlei TaxID=1437360 RepID=A0A1M5HBL7_9BRAD|nr:Dolichyl-phosphate-mannose-protein mannosyltransferase [Bradyrhizobium erythrophlei]